MLVFPFLSTRSKRNAPRASLVQTAIVARQGWNSDPKGSMKNELYRQKCRQGKR